MHTCGIPTREAAGESRIRKVISRARKSIAVNAQPVHPHSTDFPFARSKPSVIGN